MKKLYIAAFVAICLLAISVYRAKLGAQDSERAIKRLEGEISALEEELSVLRAEEAHLSRPERIGPIARDQLGMSPVKPDQLAKQGELAEQIGADGETTEAASSGGGQR